MCAENRDRDEDRDRLAVLQGHGVSKCADEAERLRSTAQAGHGVQTQAAHSCGDAGRSELRTVATPGLSSGSVRTIPVAAMQNLPRAGCDRTRRCWAATHRLHIAACHADGGMPRASAARLRLQLRGRRRPTRSILPRRARARSLEAADACRRAVELPTLDAAATWLLAAASAASTSPPSHLPRRPPSRRPAFSSVSPLAMLTLTKPMASDFSRKHWRQMLRPACRVMSGIFGGAAPDGRLPPHPS